MHCYCFSKKPTLPECAVDVLRRLSTAMACPPFVDGKDATVRLVRDVAPRKTMLCVEFVLPRAVAFATPPATQQPVAKRPRTGDA